MKGFVPTPPAVVDSMVSRLFANRRPTSKCNLLDPGCGNGEFIDGVVRWCNRHGSPLPSITGVELDPERSAVARSRFASSRAITIHTRDFLQSEEGCFDFIVGNPPYVPITELDDSEKRAYRSRFRTASGRFDLYFLFWERALSVLAPKGRLVYVTPEKYLTVASARPLRRLLAQRSVSEVTLLPENTFAGHTTYPTITVVDGQPSETPTVLRLREGITREAYFPSNGASMARDLYGNGSSDLSGVPLGDICHRISCGVATGADRVFVRQAADLFGGILDNAFPTISGRQLASQSGTTVDTSEIMLVPYDLAGKLLRFSELDGLGAYLSSHRSRLEDRTCAVRKPWYAFHETPPMEHLLRPKILCRDIADEPRFWLDASGEVIPRHSVYYLVPRNPDIVHDLTAYLNSTTAKDWLRSHCQRAANGYLRLQSTVLRSLPVPEHLASG